MTGTNPTPRIRFSYAEGNVPDFTVAFNFSMSENALSYTIDEQTYSLTREEFMEYASNPGTMGLLFNHIYADESHVLATTTEGVFALYSGNNGDQLSPVAAGASGTVSHSGGTVTVTLDLQGTTTTQTFELPDSGWCYYADRNGDYGGYSSPQISDGLYAAEGPLCPMAVYYSEPTQTAAIIYNGYKQMMAGSLGRLELVTEINDGVLTDIHWITDATVIHAQTFILPLSIQIDQSLAIPIAYDSTTRHISLPQGHDLYGGATTDVNSVKLSFTGIEPEGTNFIARVDFAVLVETGNRVVNRPFILLEQNGDKWEAVIPNAILRATKDVHRLPLQLILANDSQVINSRNTIVLETTTAIDATTSGNEIPDYEMPDWPLPTGVSESLDVLTLDVTYDPLTRTITMPDSDMYGGATIDTNSVRVNVTGIPAECDARLDFATAIRMDSSTVIKPFVVLDSIGNVFSAMIPQSVLMAARETKKLPFQLVTRHGDTVINSRNTIVLEITRAINAMESVESAYTPYVMYRNDTWEWVEDFTYDMGSVVIYNGEMYTSLADNNLGYQPDENPEKWSLLTGVESVVLGNIEGTRTGTSITFTSEQVFEAAGFGSTYPVSVVELDTPAVTWRAEDD